MTLPKASLCGLAFSGGSSSRMGRDKALLTFPDGRSFLEVLQHGLSEHCSQVGVSASVGRYQIDLPHVPDLRENAGPCAGVEAGLAWARKIGVSWLLSWPVDTPIVPRVLVQRLIAHVKDTDAHSSYVVHQEEAAEALRLPLCGLWSVELFESVSAYLDAGKSSVFGLHEHLGSSICRLQEKLDEPFFGNVNTEEDYRKLIAAWR